MTPNHHRALSLRNNLEQKSIISAISGRQSQSSDREARVVAGRAVEAAWGAARFAVAHSVLIVIYYLLRDGTIFQELGAAFLDERQHQSVVPHSVMAIGAGRLPSDVDSLCSVAEDFRVKKPCRFQAGFASRSPLAVYGRLG